MKQDDSRFASFAMQRDKLATDLASLCINRKVDPQIAVRVVAAVDRLDPVRFEEIQSSTKALFPEPSRHNSYLDFRHYVYKGVRIFFMFREKMNMPRRVLDIGSGSGAFVFVCDALGFQANGLDLPRASRKSEYLELNYLMADWYGAQIIEHRITPRVPLPIADRSFDDFTIWHPNFYSQWGEADWDYFLDDLNRCSTGNASAAYIRINQEKKLRGDDFLFPIEPLNQSVAKRDHGRAGKAYVLNLR